MRRPGWPFALLAAGALLFWPALATAGTCPPLDRPSHRVEVVIETPPPSVSQAYSRAQLGARMFHRPNDSVLGLTAWNIDSVISTQEGSLETDGGVCYWLERIRVTLRHTTLDVFVASEYHPTSCPYKAVLAHEERHTEVARRHLRGYVEPVRSALSALAVPRAERPLFAASRDEAAARTGETLRRLLAPIHKKMRETMGRAQDKVDTEQEYRRVQKQCRKW
jgi:hypothetical protein